MAVEPHVYPEGCVFNTLQDIAGKRITVMGLGLNGGGEASVRFFLRHGAFVTVTDMKSAEDLKPTIERLNLDPDLDKSRLTYVLGCHRIEDFSTADCVIKNPGVKFEGNKYLAEAKAVETDISIFLHFTKAPIIAVTGSKGKSSTVSAIDFGLRGAGYKTFLGGNITVSPLTFLEQTDGTTPVILELSSWQLRDLRGRKALKPHIAIITKIIPDHQNWYDDMDSYVADKRLIYTDQTDSDFTILDADEDDYLKDSLTPLANCKCWGDLFAKETKGIVVRYSSAILDSDQCGAFLYGEGRKTAGYVQKVSRFLNRSLTSAKPIFDSLQNQDKANPDQAVQIMGDLLVPGSHNKINVLNAALVLTLMNVAPSQTKMILGAWKGIPNRLERFHEWASPASNVRVVFYNDSCATVPEAAVAALKAFDSRVILITGGTDKNLNFTPLAQALSGQAGARAKPLQTYLLAGSGTDKLLAMLKNINGQQCLGPFEGLSILLGVLKNNLLHQNAERIYKCFEGDDPIPVVFSPGATSFGMFTNEFDRGRKFKDAVKEAF